MPTYTCLTTDDRYSVPSLSFEAERNEAAVREKARLDLLRNPHHQAIEVREGDRIAFVERRRPPGGAS